MLAGADTRADIYSLGCTLFFLLTGRPPFQGDTAVSSILAQHREGARRGQSMRADVPAELSAVVARMLAKDPALRFQTPVEVAQALAAFVKPGTERPSGISPPSSGVSSPGRRTAVAADTSQIKAVSREVPGTAPAPKAPAKETASVFAGLGEAAVAAKKAMPARKSAKPALTPWWKRPKVLAAAAGVSLTLILMAVIIIKGKVRPIDRETSKVTASIGDTAKLPLVEAEVVTRDVELKSGRSEPIPVRPEPVKPSAKQNENPEGARELPDETGSTPATPDKVPEIAKPVVPDANALNTASWEVVRSPGQQPQAYRDALAKAEIASGPRTSGRHHP